MARNLNLKRYQSIMPRIWRLFWHHLKIKHLIELIFVRSRTGPEVRAIFVLRLCGQQQQLPRRGGEALAVRFAGIDQAIFSVFHPYSAMS